MNLQRILLALLITTQFINTNDTVKIGGSITVGVILGAGLTYYFMSDSPTDTRTNALKEFTRWGNSILNDQAQAVEIAYSQCERDQKNSAECKKSARDFIYAMYQPEIKKLTDARQKQLNPLG